MFRDKSRVLIFAAIVLLIIVLMNGGSHWFGFQVHHHGFSWLRWILFGLLIWLVLSRAGCCGGGDEDDEGEDGAGHEDEAQEEDEKE